MSDERKTLYGEVIPPRRSSVDPSRTMPPVGLPDDVPLRIAVLGSFKYWGAMRTLAMYRKAIEAERAAIDALADREDATQRLAVTLERTRNLDKLREMEERRIFLEWEASERAIEYAAIQAEIDRDNLEAERIRAKMRRERLERQRDEELAATKKEPADPIKARIDAVFELRKYHGYIAECRETLVRERGGEEKLTPEDHDLIQNMEDALLHEINRQAQGE